MRDKKNHTQEDDVTRNIDIIYKKKLVHARHPKDILLYRRTEDGMEWNKQIMDPPTQYAYNQ